MRKYVVITPKNPKVPRWTTMLYTSLLPFTIARKIDVFLNRMMYKYKVRTQQENLIISTIIDLLHGFISGIPICCVLNFITSVTFGRYDEPPFDFNAGLKAGYRLCPKCARTGNFKSETKLSRYLVDYHYSEGEIDPNRY
jgi:hypothetical protein